MAAIDVRATSGLGQLGVARTGRTHLLESARHDVGAPMGIMASRNVPFVVIQGGAGQERTGQGRVTRLIWQDACQQGKETINRIATCRIASHRIGQRAGFSPLLGAYISR